MLKRPEMLSLENDYAAFRLTGKYTFEKAVDLVDEAISYCRANEVTRLLIDVTGLTGFPPPTTTQRFHFATQWASSGAGRVIVAVVAPPELIDPDRIGVIMGTNRGLQNQVFTDEAEAVAWLCSPR